MAPIPKTRERMPKGKATMMLTIAVIVDIFGAAMNLTLIGGSLTSIVGNFIFIIWYWSSGISIWKNPKTLRRAGIGAFFEFIPLVDILPMFTYFVWKTNKAVQLEDAQYNKEQQQKFGTVRATQISVAIKNENIRQAEEQANYQGNWTNVQRERLLAQEEVFRQQRSDLPLTRPGYRQQDVTTDQAQRAPDNFRDRVETAHNRTDYLPSSRYDKQPSSLGAYRPNDTETDPETGERRKLPTTPTFTDAAHGGIPLTGRQKDIIDAHEKTHEIFDGLTNTEKAQLKGVFNQDGGRILSGYPHRVQGDEILARMSQIKNYFGMKAGQKFNQHHLDVARKNYVRDTGLDNGMTEFLSKINNEQGFIDNMNRFSF
jgi:hypothetical protein